MARPEETLRITSAPLSKRDDINGRAKRYLIAMSLRLICFILAIVFVGTPVMWAFVVGAVFLPYFAVLMANVSMSTAPTASEYAYTPEFEALTQTPDSRSRQTS